MRNAGKLKRLLKTYGISVAELENSLALQFGWRKEEVQERRWESLGIMILIYREYKMKWPLEQECLLMN